MKTKEFSSRYFEHSENKFIFNEGNLLSNIMSGIKDLTFYNIFDKEKKPIKVLSIQLNRGGLHLSHCLDESNGKFFYIHTGYLSLL